MGGEFDAGRLESLEIVAVGGDNQLPGAGRGTGGEVVAAPLAEPIVAGTGGAAYRAGLRGRRRRGRGGRFGSHRFGSRRRRWRRRGGFDAGAALVAIVGRRGLMAVRTGNRHGDAGFVTRTVLVDRVSNAISSTSSTFFLSRTVPVAASSTSTTLERSLAVSSLPLWAASWTARPSFTVAVASSPVLRASRPSWITSASSD